MTQTQVHRAIIFFCAAMGLCSFIYLIALVTPFQVMAHSGGTYLRSESGSSTIIVEYEGEKISQYGFTRFNLNIIEATTSAEEINIPYDAVWARLEHDDEILYAGWLYKPEGLLAGFSYTFQQAGDYRMTTRFNNASGTISEGTVDFSVVGSGISESHLTIFLFGLLIGGILILSLGRNHMFGHS